jgi:hypothetical protein
MNKATTPNWYVVTLVENGKTIYRVVSLRLIGGLARIMNGMSKTLLEHQTRNGKKKLKGQFTEVGRPFPTQLKARACKRLLEGKA